MRIGVTGAKGFIGSWLIPELEAAGHEVRTTDRTQGGEPHRFEHYSVDLNYEGMVRRWLDMTEGLDAVVHLAALYGRRQGEHDLMATASTNAGLTAELARECHRRGIRFVYTSSSEVYGRAKDSIRSKHQHMERSRYAWEDATKPLNMYGLTKKWGEEATRMYCADHRILRLNMPYGPASPEGQYARNSATPAPGGVNFLYIALWSALHGLPFQAHRGTSRSYTYVSDTVRAIRRLLEQDTSGTWNVCRSDDYYTAEQIGRLAMDYTSADQSLMTVVDVPADVTEEKFMDVSPLYAGGWEPVVSFEEGVLETLKYLSNFDKEGKWLNR